MKKLLKLTLSFFFLTLLHSCQQEPDFGDDLENIEGEIEVAGLKSEIYVSDDGILNFESMRTFQKTIHWIKDLSDDEVVTWNKELNFESLYSKYMEAQKQEEKMIRDFEQFISLMMQIESDEEVSNFKNMYVKDIEAFEKRKMNIQNTYGDYVRFENNRIIGVKTYDAIVSRLINKDGFVYVAGSRLQYTENQLITIPNFDSEDGLTTKGKNGLEVFKYDFHTHSNSINKNQQDQVHHNRCSSQFYDKKKLTGNTTVTNTVIPVYNRVWVPRVCEIICLQPIEDGNDGPIPIDEGDECWESCTGGFYRNVFVRYDYINTRLQAVHRNYKIRCIIGCWEEWENRLAELTISGIHNEVIRPGKVEKYEWIKDISPRSSGTLNVTYRSDLDFTFLIFGTCPTQVHW